MRGRLNLPWFVLVIVFIAVPASVFPAAQAQSTEASPIPRLIHKDGRFALEVDGHPFLILGGQVNNSSAWPAMMPKIWPTIEALHANTVEMPIYWEQFEPSEGHFDDSVLLALLQQARQHHVHLVLLWFGTWKNGNPHYTPDWIRSRNDTYPRMVDAEGHVLDSMSPFGTATLDADKAAFRMLMKDLKAADPQHTVIMVQVENEPGVVGGGIRDFSPAAQKIFNAPVPRSLTAALGKREGTWRQVFGEAADQSFAAWAIARYIDQVAAAGKAEYPLPMYVNVWLRDPLYYQPPGTYDTGGATDDVLPIWKATVQSIDLIGPDIYMKDYARYKKVLDLYRRPDNALFVPETGFDPEYARYFFAALGNGTIGFSPFAMDEVEDPDSQLRSGPEFLAQLGAIYQAFSPMDREIAELNFEGKLQAAAQNPETGQQTLNFGSWKAVITYGLAPRGGSSSEKVHPPNGGAMVAQLAPDEFLVSAVHARVDFRLANETSGKHAQYLRVKEGFYENGQWHFLRIWNGDQTDYGLNFLSVPYVLRVRVGTY
jgi:beta-galactosidase GanA